MTNYEKIKAMSVEEMADVFSHASMDDVCGMRSQYHCHSFKNCMDCIKALLLQEA